MEKVCDNCNTAFYIPDDANKHILRRKYCSSKCSENASSKRKRERSKEDRVNARRREYEKLKQSPEKVERKREQDIRARLKVRLWLQNYKLERGCIDCGYNKHFSALQLDHEGFKSISISDARSSVKRLQKEIEEGQCVVRCANCHSIISWKRKVGLI